MTFADLTQVAMLGTERQPLPAEKGDQPLARMQAQLDVNRREEALLSSAALSGLHERIGSLPARDDGLVPEPCPSEELPRMSERAGSLLLRLLGGENTVLVPECLTLAAQAKQLALPEAMPLLLNAGSEKAELREAILPTLGARGRWLAAQNSDWAWVGGAAGEEETIWQVGEGPARLLFLQRLRRIAPARARELLVSTWKQESPEERVRFIAVLEIGLSLEDEPFLEAALDDKRKEVRRTASALLSQIPESGLAKRMSERAQALLNYLPEQSAKLLKLKKGKPAQIEVTLPAACDKAMQRDGIEVKPPHGFGEKAWWLIQMLEGVPLSLWTTRWQTAPADILAASLQGEWKKELFEAWTRAAIRQKDADWADALFQAALEGKRFDRFEGLLGALSSTQREHRLTELLAVNDAKTRELHGPLLAQCRQAWSPAFSRTVLAWLKRLTAEPSVDWSLRNQLKDYAPQLAPAVLPEVADGWPTNSKSWEFWSKGVDEFIALAQFRHDLQQSFNRQD